MNLFQCIEVDYIRSSRTIETVMVSNVKTQKMFYVYNYDGYSYRVFESVLSLIGFFEGDNESAFHFETDNQLDGFFSNVVL
jgi:hypothetical protein